MLHMEIAWAQVGVAETAGPAATPEIVQYFIDVGRPEVVSDEIAWCAAFTGAVLSRVGVSLAPIPKSERLLARSYLKIGTPIDEPRVGCLVILSRPEAGPSGGHTGFVAGWTATHVQVLSGNQSNAVNVQSFPRDRVLGYRWPIAVTAAEVTELSRSAGSAQRIQGDFLKSTGVSGTGQVVPAVAPAKPPGSLQQLTELGNQASGIKGAVQAIEAFAVFALQRWAWVAGAIAFWFFGRMAYDAWLIKRGRVQAYNTGTATAGAPAQQAEADHAQVV